MTTDLHYEVRGAGPVLLLIPAETVTRASTRRSPRP